MAKKPLIFLFMMMFCLSISAMAEEAEKKEKKNKKEVVELGDVEVQDTKEPVELPSVTRNLPAVREGITAKEIAESVNVINTEDSLKYLPSIHVRKRFIGDRNGVVATRTSGTQLSARSVVYTDGMLLSNLLGNRYSFAPRWGMVSPEEIERIDVIYGPFSAALPGNSMGAAILMTTRMPDKFEAHVRAQGFYQNYENYGTDEGFPGFQTNVITGSRHDKFRWLISYNHMDNEGHPQGFATSSPSTRALSGGETAATGEYRDKDLLGNDRLVFGATSMDKVDQDQFKAKIRYDITPSMDATYTFGLWQSDSNVTARSYLRDASGNAVYSGNVNIGGKRYTLASSLFLPGLEKEEHYMHGLALKSDTGGEWDFEAIGTYYDYGTDKVRQPSTALPGAGTGGAGTIAFADGTGWANLDLKGFWRPGVHGQHEASFGYHYDRYKLNSRVMKTDNWLTGGPTTLNSAFDGKTSTQAFFAQDAWNFSPDWELILGGRYEHWKAFDGATSSSSATIAHAERSGGYFSPKASLSFQAMRELLLRASFGRAVRMPTVNELFQGSVRVDSIVNNDPNLKPEKAWSSELTAEHDLGNGNLRLSFFEEEARDVLYYQTDLTVFPYVTNFQNIDKVRTLGVELAYHGENVLLPGLDLNGSVTFADSEIKENMKNPDSVGKKQPRVPDWRATGSATWHQNNFLNYTAGLRFSGRQYNTMENNDPIGDTYGGTSNYLFVDLRMNYKFADRFTASLGVDNVNNDKAYVYHPYPQRVFHAQLKYDY